MPRTLVCISASDGAGGEEIAPLVARRLGLLLVDEQIVARAAEEAGSRHMSSRAPSSAGR